MILKDLLRSSFRLIQEMAPGQTANTDDNTDAIFVLNAMLDAFPVQRLNCFTESISAYTLVANQPSYTIGPTGDFNVVRPIRIDNASIVLNPLSTLPIEIPLHIVRSESEWQEVSIKAITSPISWSLYNDEAFPLSTLKLYPISSAANGLILYTRQAFTAFAAISDTVVLPPGYADFIRYNLAVRLAPEWGRVLRADVLERARETKFAVMQNNISQETMRCDSAVLKRHGYGFNWFNRESS